MAAVIHLPEPRECRRCHGFGGWEETNPGTMGWNGNIAPDPTYNEWVRCWDCRGTGERQ